MYPVCILHCCSLYCCFCYGIIFSLVILSVFYGLLFSSSLFCRYRSFHCQCLHNYHIYPLYIVSSLHHYYPHNHHICICACVCVFLRPCHSLSLFLFVNCNFLIFYSNTIVLSTHLFIELSTVDQFLYWLFTFLHIFFSN